MPLFSMTSIWTNGPTLARTIFTQGENKMTTSKAGPVTDIAESAVRAMGDVATRADNQLSSMAVQAAKPELKLAVENAIRKDTASEGMAIVATKSAWLSKINLTQLVATLAMLLTYFGIDLDAPTQASIIAGILAAQAVLTWILKTWFTNTVTPSSVGKA